MKKTNIILLFFLAFLLLIPLVDLLHPGFAITHDGQDHIARIANFYANLQQGILIPRWAANLNWGYGHPILMFLYPLPSYISSLFHFLGFSLIDSTKIVYFLGMFASGFAMYAWLSRFWNKEASLFGSLLYVIAPYRFVEIYVRGDIGENLAFVFVPLVLLYIHNLSVREEKEDIVFGSLSFALLILAHNAISLMFLPFFLLYIFYKAYVHVKKKKKFLIRSSMVLLLGFALSAFFWVPGLLEGKYTLRNIVTSGSYNDRFTTFSALLYGPWSYGISGQFTVQLGIINWISVVLSLTLFPILYLKKDKKVIFSILLILTTFFAIFLMLPYSQFIWAKIMLLQNFQFPWRFLAITVFTTATLGALIIASIPSTKLRYLALVVGIVSILFFNRDYWHAKGYMQKKETFFTGIYNGTTDTGESAPIWSVRFMEKTPKLPMQVIAGNATITQLQRKITYHSYTISSNGNARILENTLYFPGWSVKVDGNKVPVQFQDERYRGLMTFYVPNGKHQVEIAFGETKLRLISDLISVLAICILISIELWGKVWFKR